MNPRLTIVIPLKGRHLFTFRMLWHAEEARLPYRFLLADGLVNEAVAKCLEASRSIFPHLDIEYIRYPDDADFSCYFAKMADAFTRVRTPYVMNMDNDDFLGVYGTERAVDFLDANSDFVCARGRSVGFSVFSGSGALNSGIYGKFNRLKSSHDLKDITAAAPAERLRHGGLCHAVYSAVFRTEAAVRIWRETAEINFSDLMLQENFYALRTLTLGKVHMNKGTVSKYPQALTGISHRPTHDWAARLIRSRFTADAQAMIKCIALAAAGSDAGNTEAIARDVREMLGSYYHSYLSSIYGHRARIKRALRHKWPRIVNAVQTRPRFSIWRERAALFADVKEAGGSAEDLRRLGDDLAAVERALSRKAFVEYAGSLLPLVQSGGDREWLYI
jgi:glycosyltransferase domain-containing protein